MYPVATENGGKSMTKQKEAISCYHNQHLELAATELEHKGGQQ